MLSKTKVRLKNLKNDSSIFRHEKQGKNGHILEKI